MILIVYFRFVDIRTPHVERAFGVSGFVAWRIRKVHPSKADRFTPQPRCEVEHVVGDAVPTIHGLRLIFDFLLSGPE